MFDLLKYPAYKLAKMVRNGEITSADLVKLSIDRIKNKNDKINAVIHLRIDKALEEAQNIKDYGQPFLGVPILIKGLGQPLLGEPDTNGNVMFKNNISSYTSNFVKKLQSLGFIIIGQTNFPEFGLKNITDSKLYGITYNPWNIEYNAGGSSGGSAAAVASGFVPLAAGNDGGGSIRIPASWNGLIGLKPTRGRIINGPFNWRSWQGASINFCITRYVKDTAILLDFLQCFQNENVYHYPTFKKGFINLINNKIIRCKVGYTMESPVGTNTSFSSRKAVEEAVQFLIDNGFEVEEVSIPINGKKMMDSYYTMNEAEIAAMINSLDRDLQPTINDMELLSWALFKTGENINASEYINALRVWDDAEAKMNSFHEKYPLLLTPTTAYAAPKINKKLVKDKYIKEMKNIVHINFRLQQELIYNQWLNALSLTPFTQQANLTGEPAISLPTYIDSEINIPLGIQFQAAQGREDLLLSIANLFENEKMFKIL